MHRPDRQEIVLQQAEGGWWCSPEYIEHGSDYAYSLDGAPPRPDPRSSWQPKGVHRSSRYFDTRLHCWNDQTWMGRDVRGAVVYELHVGTFTPEGTLDAAVARLDYLTELDIDMIELMPLAAFEGRWGWGYDGVALYSVHEQYGGPAALQRFVDAAHCQGLAVCLDVVYNHLGPSGNYLAEFGPYFSDRHVTPWGPAINLDGDKSGEVRTFIIDNALRWFNEFHIDALRLDAAHALIDESEQHLLVELSNSVAALSAQLNRPMSLIAEYDGYNPHLVRPTGLGGLGLTAQWADDVHHAIHATISGERHGYYTDFGSFEVLQRALTQVFVHDGVHAVCRPGEHESPVICPADGHRYVVCAANHDHIGNRTLGDRPARSLSTTQLAICAALVLTTPFTPLIFMGEEWGAQTPWQFFFVFTDLSLAKAVRKGRRDEFNDQGRQESAASLDDMPEPQSTASFEASKLDWNEKDTPTKARLLEWYRTLIRLRKENAELYNGELESMSVDIDDQGLCIHIIRGSLHVIVNLSDVPMTVNVTGLRQPIILANWHPERMTVHHVTDIEYFLELVGQTVVVLKVEGSVNIS